MQPNKGGGLHSPPRARRLSVSDFWFRMPNFATLITQKLLVQATHFEPKLSILFRFWCKAALALTLTQDPSPGLSAAPLVYTPGTQAISPRSHAVQIP